MIIIFLCIFTTICTYFWTSLGHQYTKSDFYFFLLILILKKNIKNSIWNLHVFLYIVGSHNSYLLIHQHGGNVSNSLTIFCLLFIALYCRQLYADIKIKNKIETFCPSGLIKLVFFLRFFVVIFDENYL